MSRVDLVKLKQRLYENQYKLTPQRKLILQIFLDHQEAHLCAEDVHQMVKQEASDIGLATVYRTLELLSELGILIKMDFGDGRCRYEVNNDSDCHHHHHLICLSCGKVCEFEDDLLESLETAISKKSHFKVVDHQLKFFGYCQECQKTSEI